MRILVTGGAGFIGSHIVEALLDRGHRVTVADDLSAGRLANLPDGVEVVRGSVLGPVWSQLSGPYDAVVHAAAQTSVAASTADPLADATTNILGTIKTVLGAAELGAGRLVYLSSAAVYENVGNPPFSEEHSLAPSSPYGLSKLAGELYVRLLAERAGLNWLALRLANVYGPRQSITGEAGVVARWCHALTRGEPLTLYGNGQQSRDFIFVGDVASAVARAVEAAESNAVLNVGTGEETPIAELLSGLELLAGRRATVIAAPPRPGDIDRSALDSRAARQRLGWAPAIPLQEGLAETLRWAESQA